MFKGSLLGVESSATIDLLSHELMWLLELAKRILRCHAGVRRYETQAEAPVLLIWGEDDRLLHVSGAEKFEKGLKHCRVITLPKCGHVVFFDQPRATERAYRDFLKGVGHVGLPE